MSRKRLVCAIVFLFLASSVVPQMIGSAQKIMGQDLSHDFYAYHSIYNRAELPQYQSKQDIIKNGVIDGNQDENPAPCFPSVFNGGPMDSAWPMMSHDVRHTGRSSYNTTQNPDGVEKWMLTFQTRIDSGVAIDQIGIIYFGDCHSILYAFYPNGTMKWETDLESAIIDVTPAIDESGVIYVATDEGYQNYIYAVYSSNGTTKWRHSTRNSVSSSPAIADDGTIYFGDWSGYVNAYNPNGTIKWEYRTGDIITGSPAIGPDGTVYIGSHDSSLYALNSNNGTVKWRFYTGGWVRVSPCVGDDGTVYCVSFDNYLYAIYPNNGTMKWRTFVNAGTNPTIGSDGTIYAGWDVLYAVNPDGSVKWTFPGYAYIEGGTPCTSREGIIYYGTTSGKLIALNPDGTLRWQHNFTGPCQSPPSIDFNGTIYIGSDTDISGGFMHAFGTGPLFAEANGPYTESCNDSIQFTGDGFGGLPPYTYHWDFGDNHSVDEQNPKHYYIHAGTYNAIFTITDSQGNQSSDNATVTITYPPPLITLTRPTSGLYFFDKEILPTKKIIAIGRITIEANVTQNPLPITRVEFLINGEPEGTITSPPYKWTWKTTSLGYHTICAKAYDSLGNSRLSWAYGIWKYF